MKIIITGCTGLIGSALLKHASENPQITDIIAISRRPLDHLPIKDKVTVVILEDFLRWMPEVIERLEGAEACIWALGGIASRFPTVAEARKVNVEYTMAAVNAWTSTFVSRLRAGKRFKFIYIGGIMLDETSPSEKALVFKDTRTYKTEIIRALRELSKRHPENFQLVMAKPGGVVPPGFAPAAFTAVVKGLRLDHATNWLKSLTADELAASLLHVAIQANLAEDVTHDELEKLGKEILKSSRG